MTDHFAQRCPQCGRSHTFPRAEAGVWVHCDGCGGAFLATAPPEAPSAGELSATTRLASSTRPPKPGNFKLACGACSHRHEVPINRAGQRFACRKCGAILTIPRIGPAAPAAAPAPTPRPAPIRPPVPPGGGLPPGDASLLHEPDAAGFPARAAVGTTRLAPRTPLRQNHAEAGINNGVLALLLGGGLVGLIGLVVTVALLFGGRNTRPANEARYRATCVELVQTYQQLGDGLAALTDAAAADAAAPMLGRLFDKAAELADRLDSFKGQAVGKDFEARNAETFAPQLQAEGDRLRREVSRVAALPGVTSIGGKTPTDREHVRLVGRVAEAKPGL